MKIELKEVPALVESFRKFFPAHFHINFKWMPTEVMDAETKSIKRITVINVKVNDTQKGGEAEENWLLEYAYTLLKYPKEMDKCGERWLAGFANAKKQATLDILGHKNVEAVVKAEPNNKLIH